MRADRAGFRFPTKHLVGVNSHGVSAMQAPGNANVTGSITAAKNAVIVVFNCAWASTSGTALSVSSMSLTGVSSWALRTAAQEFNDAGNNKRWAMEMWWGLATTDISAQTLTTTWSRTVAEGGFEYAAMFNINTSTPFDPHNANAQKLTSNSSGNIPLTITTDVNNDLLIGCIFTGDNGPTIPANFTALDTLGAFPQQALDGQRQLVGKASALSETFSVAAGNPWLVLMDALQPT